MKQINAEKLAEILRKKEPAILSVALADLFVAGCYLHSIGEKEAGLKICSTTLKAINSDGVTTYFSKLISSLPENEAIFASQISAHTEVCNLFRTERFDNNKS